MLPSAADHRSSLLAYAACAARALLMRRRPGGIVKRSTTVGPRRANGCFGRPRSWKAYRCYHQTNERSSKTSQPLSPIPGRPRATLAATKSVLDSRLDVLHVQGWTGSKSSSHVFSSKTVPSRCCPNPTALTMKVLAQLILSRGAVAREETSVH